MKAIEIVGYELGKAIANTAHGNGKAVLLAVTNTIMDRLNVEDWNALDDAIDKGMYEND